MNWLILLLVFGMGIAAGMLLNYTTNRDSRQRRELERQLAEAREAHAAYRREVSDHFTKTALSVNQLTDSYRAVHEQLRDGARRLCEDDAAGNALAFDSSRLIGEAPPPSAPPAQADEKAHGEDGPPTPADAPAPPEGPEDSEDTAAVAPRDYAEEPDAADSRRGA